MLNASGTDSLEAVQYYDGLGRPTVAVATAGTQGQTACTLTTYDGSGRERRRYVPVPGSGLCYMGESDIQAASYGFYTDGGSFTENHYDALDRVTAVDIAGDAWRQAGRQDRTVYLANTLPDEKNIFTTVSNVINVLVGHEYNGHIINNYSDENKNHHLAFENQMKHHSWSKTTEAFKQYEKEIYEKIKKREQ
jgi:hypothetical protein